MTYNTAYKYLSKYERVNIIISNKKISRSEYFQEVLNGSPLIPELKVYGIKYIVFNLNILIISGLSGFPIETFNS